MREPARQRAADAFESSAAAVASKPRVRAFHARVRKLDRAWSARACVSRAVAAANGRLERIVAQRLTNAMQ
eukprot:11154346-Lingulodinium_polyedra.AAC.1